METGTSEVFATHAPAMQARKIAVVPLGSGRKPHVNSFNSWRYRPGAKIVDRWCEQFPDANIGVLPGLSGKGAMVADADTFEAADEFEDRFGKSDLHVRTRRGVHLYYRPVPFRLPGNLKKLGLEVDIKTGNQIVIAPPSIHETGHVYRLDGCDWEALDHLRSLDADKLREFLHGTKQAAQEEVATKSAPISSDREMRDDSRALWINDEVFGFSLTPGRSFDEALAMAHQLNETLATHPRGMLPADEVFARATTAWQDAQSGHHKQWGGPRRSVIRTTRDELDCLQRHGRQASDALLLLARLRTDHLARCERGETFSIASTAMAKAKFMSRHRIEKARTILLRERLIHQVSPMMNTASGRVPAQFTLPCLGALTTWAAAGRAAAGQS
jgi:bifunctional DNA primase/polymerase-like protein